MKNSIGNDRAKFTREAIRARRGQAGSGGSPAAIAASTLRWLGQMNIHTLASMMIPSRPPAKIVFSVSEPNRSPSCQYRP